MRSQARAPRGAFQLRAIGVRIPTMADGDSDRSRAVIPIQGGQGFQLIPDRGVVGMAMGSGGGFGLKRQRLGGPYWGTSAAAPQA